MSFLWISDCQSKKFIDKLIEESASEIIVGDHGMARNSPINVQSYTLPFFFINQIQDFLADERLDEIDTKCCFNFMINKKMDHRYLTIRLIEYFKLNSFNYSYSGLCRNVVDNWIFQDIETIDPDHTKFNKHTVSQILGDVTIPSRFFGIDLSTISQDASSVYDYHGNYKSWHYGLKEVFNSSLISLITESDTYEYDQTGVFTEKTLYAIMGLNIPIWPGGRRHADHFESMGFDVFSDIVDHSYQNESTLFMRVWRAFEDNLQLLSDVSGAAELRNKIKPRLLKNRDLLFSRDLIKWYQRQFDHWPQEIKDEIIRRYDFFNLKH